MRLENDILKSDIEDLKKNKIKQLEMKIEITIFQNYKEQIRQH